MDETTFQQELRELKSRVSDMANNPPSASNAAQLSGIMNMTAIQNEMFAAQLRDVRTRLDIMQSSLPQQGRERNVSTCWAHESPNDLENSEAFKNLSLNVSALNDTVRNTENRVNHLEQQYASAYLTRDLPIALRLRSLEQQVSNRSDCNVIFTPTSSETTVEDIVASRFADPAHVATNLSDVESSTSFHHSFQTSDEQERPETSSRGVEGVLSGCDDIPEPFEAICPPKLAYLDDPTTLIDIVNASATSGGSGHLHDAPMAATDSPRLPATSDGCSQRNLAREPCQPPPATSTNQKNFNQPTMAWYHHWLELQHVDYLARVSEKDSVIAHLNTCRSAAEEAFQITRDDLEARLVESEEQVSRWKNEAQAAHDSFEAMSRCNRELQDARDHTVGRLKLDLQQCEASRHHFMTKYVDENYRFKWLEQRKLQVEQKLYQQLDECEHALENSERSREADIRHALQGRDADLEQLHAFCQEKEVIVSHQENLIAQGASILQERDAEIDRLNIALDKSEKDRDYDQEQADKFRRTIKKREDVIEDMKGRAVNERNRRFQLENLMRRDADMIKNKSKDVRFEVEERIAPKSPLSPKPIVQRDLHGKVLREQSPSSPQPLHSRPMAREQKDVASLWHDGGYSAPKHQFGVASPIARRRKHHASDDITGNWATRYSDNADTKPPFGFKLGLDTTNRKPQNPPWSYNRFGTPECLQQERTTQETQLAQQQASTGLSNSGIIGGRSCHSGIEAQAAANSGSSENRRHALPLDGTWVPPLPARPSAASASVAKVSSAPDMRAGNERDAGAISKPASMLELRPQRYHPPSVETEVESAEDQGGSSLLDC